MDQDIMLSKQESYNIQILRGIAIFAVVSIHNTTTNIVEIFCRPFLNYAVALFIFLSGMLTKSNVDAKKRIIKILIPYIIWTFIYTVGNNLFTIKNIPLDYIRSLILANSNGAMYFVPVYCQLTLLIPIIDKVAHSKFAFIGLIISPIEIVLFRLIPIILEIDIPQMYSSIIGISCIGWFSYYYLGYLLGNKLYVVKNKQNKNKMMVCCAFAIVLQIIEGCYYFLMGNNNCGTQLKISAWLTNMLFLMIFYNFIKSNTSLQLFA